jgi:uncharacterized protein YdcH (DUF465 family)
MNQLADKIATTNDPQDKAVLSAQYESLKKKKVKLESQIR